MAYYKYHFIFKLHLLYLGMVRLSPCRGRCTTFIAGLAGSSLLPRKHAKSVYLRGLRTQSDVGITYVPPL